MNVSAIVEKLSLRVFGGNKGLANDVTGGYTSDLLSDVMGHANAGAIWVTLQTHKNVAAIASLKEVAAVVFVKGYEPDADTLAQANEEGIPLLGTNDNTFEINGKLYDLLKE